MNNKTATGDVYKLLCSGLIVQDGVSWRVSDKGHKYLKENTKS